MTDKDHDRKQSVASIHSEKVESRKQSRVSAHDHSEKEEEKEDVGYEKNVSSLTTISTVTHMLSSVKTEVEENKEYSVKDTKADDEKEDDKDKKKDSSPSILSISHMVSSIKSNTDDKDEKDQDDLLPTGSLNVFFHKAKDLDGNWNPQS